MIVTIAPKSRITNVEVTVVRLLHIAVPEIGLFIDFGGLFLLLFWTSKKVSSKFKKFLFGRTLTHIDFGIKLLNPIYLYSPSFCIILQHDIAA